MSRSTRYQDDLDRRKALLDGFGGLSGAATRVRNSEWAYMLEEETRQSLAIEGYFSTEEELKDILGGRKGRPEIVNYHRAAQSVYDFALQYYREGEEASLNLPMVRHVHSELFREVRQDRGRFRSGSIMVRGARVRPPEFDVDGYVRVWVALSMEYLGAMPLLAALSRIHTLFESIHPFEDGNGRAGRILMNYLGVSRGYPLIVIKGTRKEDRERYYEALEAADAGFHEGFPDPDSEEVAARLDRGNFEPLEELLYEGLVPRLDQMTAASLETTTPLMTFEELAPLLGVKPVTLRQWVSRNKLIAVKRNGRLYSHPDLRLG